MSRFSDYDDFDGEPEQILAQGRWKRNALATLRSKRGRAALAEIRVALLALPEHKLIDGAMCTVGDVDTRFPAVTDAEVDAERAKLRAAVAESRVLDRDWADRSAEYLRRERDEEREAYLSLVRAKGAGVCLVGAYAWHKKVREGMDPAEAFAALPSLGASDTADALSETAELGESIGLAYTLAWELAYRNDETYGRMTPEQRHAAFVAWIDERLAVPA